MYNSDWYSSLILPPFTPPAWLFPPAWIFLYLTIFIALMLFIITPTYKSKRKGFILFFAQLLLNLLWSPAFFYLKNPLLAFVIIIFLDILVFLNIKEFKKFSKISTFILLPYLVWILFATYLNLGILILN